MNATLNVSTLCTSSWNVSLSFKHSNVELFSNFTCNAHAFPFEKQMMPLEHIPGDMKGTSLL